MSPEVYESFFKTVNEIVDDALDAKGKDQIHKLYMLSSYIRGFREAVGLNKKANNNQ